MQLLIDIALSLIYLCAFLLICAWSWRFWKMYVNQKFLDKFNNDSILLEIKLPRDIMKSPLATEVAVTSLLQSGGVGHWYAREFQGNLPAYASLEIASLEGIIHFYVRINKKFRSTTESSFYAQYPGIEIVEVDDYTKLIRYHHLSKDVSLWGAEFPLGEKWVPKNPETGEAFKDEDGKDYKMKADFLPIKTYVDYGLDKDPKEEFKTDPIAPIIEFMGSVGKGEYFWYQIMLQDEGVYNGDKFPKFYVNKKSGKNLSLREMADERKKQIRTASWNIKGKVFADEFGVPKVIDSYSYDKDEDKYKQLFDEVESKDKDGKTIITKVPKKAFAKHLETKAVSKKEVDLTQADKDEIEVINRKISKPLALTIVRLLYVAKKENFSPQHIQNILSLGKPFKGANSFGLSPTDPYDFPWQKIGEKRVHWRSEELFEAYVEREGFFPHVKDRNNLDKWEDVAFYPYTMKSRKIFRMIYEAIFYPFEHPTPKNVSIMNIEEIATMWHLPGQVVGTPTLPRIDSNKGMAPTNLPQ